MDPQPWKSLTGFFMSSHSRAHWLQLGRFGGEQEWRTDSLEQEPSEIRNGEPERSMDRLEIERKWKEEQLEWGFVGGWGERVRELELGSYLSREKEMLLMEMVEEGVEHLIWKEGWPHPGDREKGKGGIEVKGEHGDLEKVSEWEEHD